MHQLFVTLCMVMILAAPSIAQAADSTNAPSISAEQQVTSWTAELDRMDRAIDRNKLQSAEIRTTWQETLNQISSEARLLADKTKAALESEQSVLRALGDAPEDSSQETASIRAQREELNARIAKIDSDLKRANITLARVDEVRAIIDAQKKAETRSKLFSRSFMPLSPDAWAQIAADTSELSSVLTLGYSSIFLMVGMLVLIGLSFPVTRYLNHFFAKTPYIELLHQFSRRRLLLMVAAMYFVFLLRIGALNLGELTTLEDALQAFASICLALILFGALGKFEFIDKPHRADALGEHKRSYHGLFNSIKRLIRLLLAVVPIASLAGYVNLALYLSFNITLTFAAILLFIWLRGLAVQVSGKMTSPSEASPKELSPLAVSIIEPILALFSLSLILFFWGMTTEDITSWFAELKHGVQLGDITIDFVSIGTAVSLFFALWLTTKIVQWFLNNRVFQYTKLDSGIRDAIIAITGYIGIIFAVVAAMGAMGLDMSNIAIVAGALSVGIGFGLQAIFNNFVSGLILLFERPVKVGDWVVVGENQGVIKKIRVRSTEIETFWNSSVIVPNSQLISETVINWTLHDRAGRVDMAVGVAYGSDTEQVRQVLLDVAKAHPQVRSYPETRVIFTEFGDSSLNFELRCFIHNIRDVYTVTSDLRFAVYEAFREHNIEIPFPQRDLHIKSTMPLTVNPDA